MLNRAALFLAVLSSALAQPARPGRLNPPHLNEMPLVERVLREITAPTTLDAAARQAGAFEQLNEVIEELSGGRTAIGQPTPDETRIMGEYRQARFEVMQKQFQKPGDEERLLPVLRRFDEDPGLRDELVNRFFSPALRAQSVAISRTLQARRSAMRQQNTAFGGAAIAPTAAAPAPVQPAPRAPSPLGPPDPSILKARAAKVDTNVFGIPLGEPLSLPACAVGLLTLTQPPPATCVQTTDALMNALMTAIDGDKGDLANIKLSSDRCPTWISECTVTGKLEGGRLVSVVIRTAGPKVEKAVGTELAGKYGSRFTAQQRIITPGNGSAKFDVWDRTWELPGLNVVYRVVEEDIFHGMLRIETEAMAARRGAAAREAARPKL